MWCKRWGKRWCKQLCWCKQWCNQLCWCKWWCKRWVMVLFVTMRVSMQDNRLVIAPYLQLILLLVMFCCCCFCFFMALLFLTYLYTLSTNHSSFIMFVVKTKWKSQQNKSINFENIYHYYWDTNVHQNYASLFFL